jgi:integrase
MIAPVAVPLGLWHKNSDPSEGWVFPNRSGAPMNIREFCRRRIRPKLQAKNVPWKGLYAGRRTAATVLTQLTGNPIAASQLLRHRNMGVTMSAYIKSDRMALVGGLKMLETKIKNRQNE